MGKIVRMRGAAEKGCEDEEIEKPPEDQRFQFVFSFCLVAAKKTQPTDGS